MEGWKCARWIALLLLFILFAHPIAAPAQITAALTHWQSAQWWRNTATLDLDFINDRYYLNGTQYSGVSNFITGSSATFSRNSVGTYFNSSGTLTTASVNTPRLDHSPTSPYAAEGILIEESRTNSIRNNTMSGAAVYSTTELTNDGNFALCTSGSTCSGWSTTLNGGSGSVSFASGSATLTGDGTHAASIYQAITTISGYIYNIAVTTGPGVAVTYQAGGSTGATNYSYSGTLPASASTTTNFWFVAPGTTAYIQINNTTNSAASVTQLSVQSGGVLPTNWSISRLGLNNIIKIIGTGTQNGINYIDVQSTGTDDGNGFRLALDTGTAITAATGQTWTNSYYTYLVSGSLNGRSPELGFFGLSSSGAILEWPRSTETMPTGSYLSADRISYSGTFTTSGDAYAVPTIEWNPWGGTSGGTVNYTLRIGMPQLELGAFPTSVIPTSGSAVTRAADVFTVPTTAAGANGAWYTQGVGTLFGSVMAPYLTSSDAVSIVDIDDGTSNNAIQTFLAPNGYSFEMINGGTPQYQSDGYGSYTTGTLGKTIQAYQTNSANQAYNGTLVYLSSSVSVPTALTTLRIGERRGANGSANGWINRIWYMPTRQPDASLTGYTQ